MIRYYCDLCGKEVGRNAVTQRLITELEKKDAGFVENRVKVECAVEVNGTWNDGEVCLACVRRVVAEGREIPR